MDSTSIGFKILTIKKFKYHFIKGIKFVYNSYLYVIQFLFDKNSDFIKYK